MEIKYSEEFRNRVPHHRIIVFEADVVNSLSSTLLLQEMKETEERTASSVKLEEINSIPAIKATRQAYKACGKDPNRYRPSQEQLMRRLVRGLGLYSVNALVDTGNQLSIATGCSVGCFDADKIEGNVLVLGIGCEGEPYEGIGRGKLNIAGLPVIRDVAGGIGTPTSDNERTKISLDTKRIITTVHLFDPKADADSIVGLYEDLLKRHCRATEISHKLFSSEP